MIAPNYIFYASVVTVHDGDTVRLRIDLGFDRILTDQWIRLENCYAPELTQPGGDLARKVLTAALAQFDTVIVQTKYTFKQSATDFNRSFVRFIGSIFVPAAQVCLNDLMVAANLATRGTGLPVGAPVATGCQWFDTIVQHCISG